MGVKQGIRGARSTPAERQANAVAWPIKGRQHQLFSKQITLTPLIHNAHYAGKPHIKVMLFGGEPPAELDPEALNGTNQMELFVFENTKNEQAVLIARLDNLGKGAGRAALQNAGLMLGLK